MRSFTIDNFRFDVISHERVLVGDTIEERFVVECYLNGLPLPWSTDYPNAPQRENFKFVGKASVDVYNNQGVKVGTKRGADFRTNFHRVLYRRAEAVRTTTRIGQVLNSRVETRTAAFRDQLKVQTIDAAAIFLTDNPLVVRRQQ